MLRGIIFNEMSLTYPLGHDIDGRVVIGFTICTPFGRPDMYSD